MNQIKIRAQFQSNYFHLKAFQTHLNIIKLVYSWVAQVHSLLYNKQWLLNHSGIVSDTLYMKTQSRLLWCEVYIYSIYFFQLSVYVLFFIIPLLTDWSCCFVLFLSFPAILVHAGEAAYGLEINF